MVIQDDNFVEEDRLLDIYVQTKISYLVLYPLYNSLDIRATERSLANAGRWTWRNVMKTIQRIKFSKIQPGLYRVYKLFATLAALTAANRT